MVMPSQEYGERLVRVFEDDGLRKTAANKVEMMLRAQIFEGAVLDRVIPPTRIGVNEVDLDEDTPGGYKYVIHKEYTDVRAVTTGYRGLADLQYVEAEGYAIRFFKLESDIQEITEGELRGLRIPFADLIRKQIAFQISKQRDIAFKGQVEYALSLNPGEQVIQSTNKRVTLEDLVDLKNVLDGRGSVDGRYLETATFVMTKIQYNNLTLLIQSNTKAGAGTGPGLAGGITQEYWRDGYVYEAIAGCKIVVTRKNDIFLDNVIYAFPQPEFVGHNLTFAQPRFMVRRIWDRYQYKGMDDFAFNIGNTYAVAKLVLAA